MAITGEARHELHKHFEQSMGPRLAADLMDLLPPVGWGEVATKQDLTTEVAAVRKDLTAEVTALGKDIDHLRQATERNTEHVCALMDKSFVVMAGELRSEFNKALRMQFGAIAVVMIGLVGAVR